MNPASFHSSFHTAPLQPGLAPVPALAAASEEQQLSLALARSVAEQTAWERRALQASTSTNAQHGRLLQRTAGEALSQKLWQLGSLGYGEVITDGFYDIYGDYPEVQEGAEFPGLEHLRKVRVASGDVREVLAHVVCDRFGGTYDSESSLEHFWQVSSSAEKRRNHSAVVLLCRLEVGAARHRAILFKVLADAAKLQCSLIRGQVLCGADNAANVLVMVDGREHVVDLVFEPGRLYTPEEFAALVQLRRTKRDSWQRPPAAQCVETSAVSASSTSSTSTTAGGTPPHSGAAAATGNGAVAPGLVSVGSQGSAAAPGMTIPGAHAAAASVPLPAHDALSTAASTNSPRATHPRPLAPLPPVPVYSSSLPPSGGLLGPGHGAMWGLGTPQVHGNGPAISGSRVRFTITDLPKSQAAPPQPGRGAVHAGPTGGAPADRPAPARQPASGGGGGGVGGSSAGARPPHPAGPATATSAPLATSAGSGSGSGAPVVPSSSGRHGCVPYLPAKARSMLDLGGSHGGPDDEPSGSDLIRLDSEPLPADFAAHCGLEHGGSSGGVLSPEPSTTPTGQQQQQQQLGGPPPPGGGLLNRNQGSLDQNGWVKFSGSFGRAGEGRPGGQAGGLGLGPSPLAHASSPGPSLGPSSAPAATTAGAPGVAVAGLVPQPTVDSSGSLASACAASSPDAAAAGGRGGSVSGMASMAHLGAPASGGSGALPGAAPAAPAAGPVVGGMSGQSPFAHFLLPSSGPSMSLPVGSGSTAASPNGGGSTGNGSTALPGSGQQQAAAGAAAGQQRAGLQQQQQQPGPGPQKQQGPHGTSSTPFAVAPNMARASLPPHAASYSVLPQHPSPPHPGSGGGGGGGGVGGLPPTAPPAPGGVARVSSVSYVGQGQPPPPMQPPYPGTRQPAAGSHDPAGSRGAPMSGGAAGAGPGVSFTPPSKSAGGEAGSGSKAPSPSLSTPFALTPSSVQSTPPGSAPAGGTPFGDLSPFSLGEGPQQPASGSGSAGGRRGDKPGGKAGERERAQGIFADLSPFNTGASGSTGGGDRDSTPPGGGRSGTPSGAGGSGPPIVEMPSSDTSRDGTPRVSFSSVPEQQGPSSGGIEAATLDLSRMRLGSSNGRADASVGRVGGAQHHQHHHHQQQQQQQQNLFYQQQQQQQAQQQQLQAFGPMMMGHAAAAAAQQQQQQQQQQAMSLYAAAMQGGPHAQIYLQQAFAAATSAGIFLPVQQGYMPHMGGGVGGPAPHPSSGFAWRPSFDAPQQWGPGGGGWGAPALAQQQQQQQQQVMAQQQFLMQTAFLQQQQQHQQQHQQQQHQHHQQQQQQQHQHEQQQQQLMAGLGGSHSVGGLGGEQGPERRTSMMAATTTTTTVIKTHVVEGAGAPSPFASAGPQAQLRLDMPQQHALPAPQQQQQGGRPSGMAGFSHEMTIPSQQRLAAMQGGYIGGGGSHSGGGDSGSSPLGLQPTLSASMPLPAAYKELEIDPSELTYNQRIGIGRWAAAVDAGDAGDAAVVGAGDGAVVNAGDV
ncbi:Serine/threonine-protein kinase CTR1 [Tetrabaena socialis]|uniref:Serine/threonine-protein kinase CTR1 n=1 Tax=Tetrabaena socialis TaxID=47790 RepID=A0A2J7ZT87_9CHLO|nr:Serine/threonine-protein kinase CTR1 [Tetrabaena socialis]|eukprot:PNH03484.1 Serine/threonine-protein kinase CTR1 [Tetrabaena socialis]